MQSIFFRKAKPIKIMMIAALITLPTQAEVVLRAILIPLNSFTIKILEEV